MSTANDNTAKWAVRKFGGAGLPVGFEYLSMNPNIPAGSLPLLGGVYSRTVYKDLWAWVQEQAGYLIEESEWQEKSAANEGNVPFYSTGDGVSTFRVPSLKCWVKGANGIEEVGSYLSAGLPNITGNLTRATLSMYDTVTSKAGALDYTTNSGVNGYARNTGGTYNLPNSLSFDASKSNAIYGNSDTVQPKSIVGMWLVKAYGTVTNSGNMNIDAIAQGLTELESRVTPIDKGGTGASSASGACANIGALPTTGGVIIGQTAMVRNVANSSLRIGGGLSYEAGASLSLCGKSMTNYAGQFLLGAGDETAKKYLNGLPSGELYWDSKRVLTCDTSYNSTSKQSVLKFSDGTMIICGTVTTNTSAYVNITYNVPFNAIPYSFTCTKKAEGALLNHYTGTSEETATGLQVKTNLTGVNAVVEFMALGRWY